MDTSAYIAQYTVLISSAFCIASLILVGYSVLAPWYRTGLGRLIWSLWLAITLILFVPFLQSHSIDFAYSKELFVGAMYLFNLVLIFCGYGIYTKQIKGYLRNKKFLRKIRKGTKET